MTCPNCGREPSKAGPLCGQCEPFPGKAAMLEKLKRAFMAAVEKDQKS